LVSGRFAALILDIRDPFVEVTANNTVTTEAPQWLFSQRGRIPG
jgi:hypothetical protein